MRLPNRGRSGGLKFNLTPMIDVVFNLIIFFLAASHLARSEALEPVHLPEASTGKPEEPELQRRLTVTIAADETYRIAGTVHTLDEVEQTIQISNAGDATQSAGLELRIRTDRDVSYRLIEPLLLSCARAGVTKIKFAVVPSAGEN